MKILLVKLSDKLFYKKAKVKGAVPSAPSLTIATLAAALKDHHVEAFDFNLYDDNQFIKKINEFKPDVVGITFVTTPFYDEMNRVAKIVKNFNKNTLLISGGPHVTCFPEDCLDYIDIAVVGEGDFTLPDALNNLNDLEKVNGIVFKVKNKIIKTKPRKYTEDLNTLPIPDWSIFDLKMYKCNKILAKKNPVGWIETSRGCVYGCIYCNKNIFGRTFRTKSPERVVDEIESMLNMGFKEIHIADDGFTTDMERSEKICDMIIERGLKFYWATVTGIRADKVNETLLEKMKKAGCYRVYFGFESGNQKILDRIRKGVTLKQYEDAVKLSKKAGLEVYGFFMIGLPDETEETMKDTIEFAKKLDLDAAKMSIMIPLPGTPIYSELNEKGLIKTKKWSQFNFYSPPKDVFDHPNLGWDIIEKYYNRFYKEFYFRPKFITKRLIRSLINRSLLTDIKTFLNTEW